MLRAQGGQPRDLGFGRLSLQSIVRDGRDVVEHALELFSSENAARGVPDSAMAYSAGPRLDAQHVRETGVLRVHLARGHGLKAADHSMAWHSIGRSPSRNGKEPLCGLVLGYALLWRRPTWAARATRTSCSAWRGAPRRAAS